MTTHLNAILMYVIYNHLTDLSLVPEQGIPFGHSEQESAPAIDEPLNLKNLNSYPFAKGYELRFFGSASLRLCTSKVIPSGHVGFAF
jgi:hypothetical protein